MFIFLPNNRDVFNFVIANFPHNGSNIPTSPRMECILHSSSFTLKLAVVIRTFYNVTVLWVLNPPPPVYSGVRVIWSLVLYACFVGRCLSFSLHGHCVICSSLILVYGFWLPLWYLQSLLLWYTESDYPFGIFKNSSSLIYGIWLPLWYLQKLFFFDIWNLITPLVSSNSSSSIRKMIFKESFNVIY